MFLKVEVSNEYDTSADDASCEGKYLTACSHGVNIATFGAI